MLRNLGGGRFSDLFANEFHVELNGGLKSFYRHADCPDCFPTSEQAEILALSNIEVGYIDFVVCFDEASKSVLESIVKKYAKKNISIYRNPDLFPKKIMEYKEYFDIYLSPKKQQSIDFLPDLSSFDDDDDIPF